MQNFGEQLISARKQKGLTQEQLAEAMAITRQGVSNWERGQSVPDAASIQRLSEILECEFVMFEDETANITVKEKIPDKKPRRRISGKSVAMCAVSFVAGLLVMFLVMRITSPVTGEQIGSGINPNTINYFTQARSYKDNTACIEITLNENPSLMIEDSAYPDGVGWMYTFYFTETNGVDFYPETYTELFFSSEGPGNSYIYSKDDIISWWGENKISANDQRTIRGGLPKQDCIGLGIELAGKDAKGNDLKFFGYVSLSQEMKTLN